MNLKRKTTKGEYVRERQTGTPKQDTNRKKKNKGKKKGDRERESGKFKEKERQDKVQRGKKKVMEMYRE